MVAGDRRRPAASSAVGTVMGSPPNRTADRAWGSTGAALRSEKRARFAYVLRKPAARRPDSRRSSHAGVVPRAATRSLPAREAEASGSVGVIARDQGSG